MIVGVDWSHQLLRLGRSGIDLAMEASVIASFTKIGYNVRSHLYEWDSLPDLTGRTIVLTGRRRVSAVQPPMSLVHSVQSLSSSAATDAGPSDGNGSSKSTADQSRSSWPTCRTSTPCATLPPNSRN